MPAETPAVDPAPAAGLTGVPPPWSLRDTWLGVAGMLLLIFLMLGAAVSLPPNSLSETVVPIADELIYLLPVAVILGWRRASWKLLGFRDFSGGMLGLGCGLLAGAYFITLVHNMVLIQFGIAPQGAELMRLFEMLDSPAGLVVAAVIAAPPVEEIFFRGFLFAGFRQAYGWNNAALLSAGIFALAHLSPVAFVPTFALGYVFAVLYQKSNSIWPGILMHFLLNAFGICVTLAASQFPALR